MVYIAGKCDSQHFREVRLERVLSYADFLAYRTTGESITGVAYVALEHGPASQCLAAVRDQFEADHSLGIDRCERSARLVALRSPDLSQFTSAEIALVDGVIDTLHRLNGNVASEPSPAFLGWKAARAESVASGEPVVIPYSTAFLSNEPLDEFEQAEGLELARKHG